MLVDMVFQRLISWIVNDLIVHRLANNRHFQKFALKIDATIEKNRTVIEKKIKDTDLNDVKQSVSNLGPIKFVRTFYAEVQKELKNSQQQQGK